MFPRWVVQHGVPGVIQDACSALSEDGGRRDEQLLIIPAVLMTLKPVRDHFHVIGADVVPVPFSIFGTVLLDGDGAAMSSTTGGKLLH